MNLFDDIHGLVLEALRGMQAEGALPEALDMTNVTVEPPRDPAHGDMATNAAMVLAKPAGQTPRDIATALADRLAGDPRLSRVEVAGPGFLNLRLAPASGTRCCATRCARATPTVAPRWGRDVA